MEAGNNIQQELAQIAPALVNIPAAMPFEVPAGYFDTLSIEMLLKTAKPEIKPAVPEGYFDAFAGNMLSKIKGLAADEDELAAVAPALAGISRSMPYNLPAGYFENLVAPIQEPAAGTAPVIPLNRSFRTFKWMAAASIIALAGFFTWQFAGHSPSAGTGGQVAVINGSDSADASIAAALQNIGDTTIDTELSRNGLAEEMASALFYLNTENFESALHDFSEEEIKNQLAGRAVVKNKS